MKKGNFIFRFCRDLMVIMQKLRTLRGLTILPNVQNEDVHFLQISYRLQVLNLNVLWKHNICRCSLAMDINFERGRKTNNMIQTHEAKIFSESKYELNKRDVFHSGCKWENHPIKTSQTLYHDESSLSGQFIWVTPHCEHQPWSPYHSPSGQHCRCLQTWSKKFGKKSFPKKKWSNIYSQNLQTWGWFLMQNSNVEMTWGWNPKYPWFFILGFCPQFWSFSNRKKKSKFEFEYQVRNSQYLDETAQPYYVLVIKERLLWV